MRQITLRDEWNLIKLEKKGFILNARPEVKRVHHVTCGSVTPTSLDHPKYFSQNKAASKKWLNDKFGAGKWQNCGYCSGLESPLG